MNKRITFFVCFLFVIVALMFTVSAAPTFGSMADPIEKIPQAHVFGDGTNANATHKDGCYNESCAKVMITYTKNGTTKTVTYPSYYILKNDTTLVWNFSYLSEFLGVEINVGNVKAIQIPFGITDIPEQAFVLPGAYDATVTDKHPQGHVATPNETLEYVFLSNSVLTIEDFAFAHCTSLSEVGSNISASGATGDHNHLMLQSIGYRAFHDCEKLASFNFNNHLLSLGEGCFEGCGFTIINLSKCVELTVIPKNCFHESEASVITEIILPTSIVEIGDNAFTGSQVKKLFLGTSLKKIGHNAIATKDLDVLILPATLETMYDDSIELGNKGYSTFVVGVKSSDNPGDIALVEHLLSVIEAAGTDFKNFNADKLCSDSFAFFSDADNAFCETYLGGHTINHSSDSITSVVYPNGIEHQGYAKGSCGICQQALNNEIQLTPIMVSKGYSLCTYNDKYAFSNGFEVYHDALAVYERVNGLCEIGIVFLLNDKYSATKDLRNDIATMGVYFDENSLMSSDQITYASIDYIMTYSKGLTYEVTNADGSVTTVDRGNAQVVIAGYMLHKEAQAGDMYNKSYYVQDADDIYISGTTTDSKYNTVSYNSIYGTAKSQGLL